MYFLKTAKMRKQKSKEIALNTKSNKTDASEPKFANTSQTLFGF